jgi:hypothetical protein
MSYTVDLVVGRLPDNAMEAWRRIKALQDAYYNDGRDKAPSLVALHSALTARYPCLSSYASDDPRRDESPWDDGPLIDRFAHELGVLAIAFARASEVVPFIVAEANALGISVADAQSGHIYRPNRGAKIKAGKLLVESSGREL